eukprot:gene1107-10621_t
MDLEQGLSALKIVTPTSLFGNGEENIDNSHIEEVDIELDTLDEPVYETIWRDLKAIIIKISLVLIPRPSNISQLKNWDLWGPLFFCLSLAITLGNSAQTNQSALVFAAIFIVFWVGSTVVTINAQFLGSELSLFQSVCILGYCVFPLVICSFVFVFISSWLIRSFILPIGLIWSNLAAGAFLSDTVDMKRRLLVVFPIVLFYLFISWLIFVQESIKF